MNVILDSLSQIKAKWVFALVTIITGFTIWLLVAEDHHNLEVSAYKFSVVIVGGLIGKALLAAGVRAYPTMMLMAVAAMTISAVAFSFTDSASFKDSAVEQMLLMLAGGLVMLMGELLARFKTDEG